MEKPLKANLHFHTAEDPHDNIKYTLKEGIKYAAKHKFEVLAVTCHQYSAWTQQAAEYAQKHGVLLIDGIELSVAETAPEEKSGSLVGKHIVLLNAGKDAESIRTFTQLEQYKKQNPGVFTMAAHPYFLPHVSLGDKLEKYIHLIDAIEYSWYYSPTINFNKRAEVAAKKHNLPLVATSDTHYFYDNHMERNYALIYAGEKTTQSVLEALKQNKFKNVTRPSKFLKHMVWGQLRFMM